MTALIQGDSKGETQDHIWIRKWAQKIGTDEQTSQHDEGQIWRQRKIGKNPMETVDDKELSATARLIETYKKMMPSAISKRALLDSEELAHLHPIVGKDGHLTEEQSKAASKTLGRKTGQGGNEPFVEVLVPNGRSKDLNLPDSGLVAISINLAQLNLVRDEKPELNISSQQDIAHTIISEAKKWLQERHDTDILITGLVIVHGSSEFDMLLSVKYSLMESYAEFIQEVVQRVPCVQRTHTMQISHVVNDIFVM